MIRLLAVLLAALPAAGLPPGGANPPRQATEWAHYQLHGERPWKSVAVVNQPGYRVILGSVDGQELTARVEVDAAPLPDESPFPPEPVTIPEEVTAAFRTPPPNDPEAEMLARLLTRGSRTVLEAVERVVAYTSRRIQYELPTAREETAESCRRTGRGSCVGRSLLAADLLVRCGVPARQVTGVLVATDVKELSAEARAVYSESLGGVRHRWIEVYVPGLGWVPSDPGGLANTVSARHLALLAPPEADFGVTMLSRTPELRWPALETLGKGLTLGRPRGGSLVVRNSRATAGGAVVLSPMVGSETASASARVVRADSSAVKFDQIPLGDYRVVWRSPDGRIEAASVRVDGPAEVVLSASPAERSGS